MIAKRRINKKRVIFAISIVLIILASIIFLLKKETLIETIQANVGNYGEPTAIDVNNWDANRVSIVYDPEGVAVPVPKGYTASSVESEKYVNGIDETHTGTKTELSFSSSGTYSWKQNSDGVWVSGNQGIVNSTSVLTSNEFEIGADGGRVTINWSASCHYQESYLYATIKNTETGEEIRSTNLTNTKLGVEYNSLIYMDFEEELEAGTYVLNIIYHKTANSSTLGLDAGYVKSASIISYDNTGTETVTTHKYGGFVIYEGTEPVTDDNVNTAQKTRNQWVWVPVSPENLSRIYNENSNGVKTGKTYNYSLTGRTEIQDGITHEPEILSSLDKPYYFIDYGLQNMTTNKFYQKMQIEFEETIESIKEYGGFYIGRYETGNISSKKPVVQKLNSEISNQNWYALYNKMKYIGANNTVKTNMIWGCLWDETLQWFVDNGSLKQEELAISTSWGNYVDSTFTYKTISEVPTTKNVGESVIIPTGSSEYTKVNNIYDMAGNVLDWTLECDGVDERYYRGGVCFYNGSDNPASVRYNGNPTYSYRDFGFRAYLYIK